jgi:hypothetical protein
LESPTISPDLESRRWLNSRPRIVRGSLMISRFFDFSSKPGLHPDQPVSPIIQARQEIFSRKRGAGVLATAPRDARVVGRTFQVANSPISAPISILETLHELSRNSFGNVAIFPLPSQPRLRPESCDSPIISAGQEMGFGK